MPASSAEMSSAALLMLSSVLAMAVARSDALRVRDFFLSSVESNCEPQYSFFSASSACSFLSSTTMSSIILITVSNPTFLPRSASTRKPRRAWSASPFTCACWTRAAARARWLAVVTATCIRLALGTGRVFLNNSSASSSFRILMVSWRARSSSARVFERSSHSAVFVSQPFSSSAKNFLSASRVFAVSSKSSFMLTISTASSPEAESFDSISVVRASISAVLAALKAS
mmetsp:Transcript_83080/g.222898  ORF Transcript_83080/g.222898 Transcript_83080/m.222898 type:complete len:229 (+) Transcript_83080:792-1478(+)